MDGRGRPKGSPKVKGSGRVKGTPNKLTMGDKDKLKELIAAMEDPQHMESELAKLHGKDYFRVYFDAMQYVRPKLSNIEYHGDMSVSNEIADRMRELCSK